MSSGKQNGDFPETVQPIFITFRYFIEAVSLKETVQVV
jgi:hypothetical protein